MATLFKLAISAETQTSVLTKPNVKKYFYTFEPEHVNEEDLIIPANAFVDDQDSPVDSITLAVSDNGYYLLFINGALQQDTLYTVTENNLQIPDVGDIPEGALFTLIVTNFVPEAESETTVLT